MTTDPNQSWQMPKPVDYVPKRVVSLVPSITESLYYLKLGTSIVGITDYCVRPPQAQQNHTKVGGTKNPDIEKIVNLNPDLVIMNTEENRVEDYEALKEKGIPVWQTGPNTVLEGINLLWEMMDIFLETEHAFGVRLIEQKYDITKLAMENERPIKTFIPIWQDPWMTANQHTYMHDVMTLFGLENVFADRERQFPLDADVGDGEPLAEDDPRREGRDTRYPRVSLEEIEATQPELIFLPNEPYEFQETDAETFFNLDIPAAKLGNIYLVEGALFMWHGAHIAYAMSQLPPMLDEVRQRLTEQDEENNG